MMYTTKNYEGEYKSLPFWSWNSKLDMDEVRNQIQDFKSRGFGGFFIHARGGLVTPYLSDEWLNCVRAAIDEAKLISMKVWLYDENGWPSGSADGVVPNLSENFQQKWLCRKEIELDKIQDISRTIGIYYKCGEGRYQRISNLKIFNNEYGNNAKVVQIYYETNPYYTDLLCKEAVAKFIENSHEVYYKHFKEEFGSAISGIFTDEPQLAYKKFPWSVDFADEFIKLRGYDLLERLPNLFEDISTELMHDFWKTVVQMFVSSYSKQIGQWCEQREINLTGHMANENGLCMQMSCNAGVMPHYVYMQMPGIDHLSKKITGPVLVKQVSSIAQQFPGKRVISEMFGCSGWNVSFQDLKWISEWQYVQGVNLSCLHIAAYSLEGCRKRDYPPAFSYQLSWWEKFHIFNSYTEELLKTITEGRNVSDILVIHPISSAWCVYKENDHSVLEYLSNEFRRVSEHLMELHCDFHYGDEITMASFGSVDGDVIKVGKAGYRLVVIPPSFSMERSTFQLLKEFIDNGGRVIAIAPFPYMLEGNESKEIETILSHSNVLKISNKKKFLDSALNILGFKRGIKILDKFGDSIPDIYYRQQECEGYYLFYLFNKNREHEISAHLEFAGNVDVKQIDLFRRTREDVDVPELGDKTVCNCKFAPAQSYVFFVGKNNSDRKYPNDTRGSSIREKTLYLNGPWKIQCDNYNSLTLDYCKYSVDNGEWSDKLPVIKVQEQVIQMNKELNLRLKFNFTIKCDSDCLNTLFLVIEKPDLFNIYINSSLVTSAVSGWWIDKGFKKINIKNYIQSGENEIILEILFKNSKHIGSDIFESERNRFFYDTELESIYLIGDFGLNFTGDSFHGLNDTIIARKGFFEITKNNTEISSFSKTLTEQGLWFYSGKVILQKEFDISEEDCLKTLVLKMKKPFAAIGEIYINEQLIGNILCEPFCFNINKYVRGGKNSISIVLYNGNRNLLGPHHHYMGEVRNVGPSSFKGCRGWEDYDFSDTPEVTWCDSYSFVKFGLNGYIEIDVYSDI